MRVVVGYAFECAEKFLHVETVNTGVDFANFFDFGVGVFVLNDLQEISVVVMDNSAVAGGVGHFGGQDGCRVV